MTGPLLRHLIRSVPWWPFAAAMALALLVQYPVWSSPEPQSGTALFGLRLAAAVLGAAAGFALPDLMASTVVTPIARWRVQWLRLAVLLVPSALAWVVLHAVVRSAGGPAFTWPVDFVILQAAVCGLLPVAAAALGARYRDDPSGALLGPAAQGAAVVVSLFFTDSSSPWPAPVSTGWTPAQQSWPVVLVLVLAVLVVANRERAAPR
ncbi:hypothetical protein [Actinoplanes utahensis]|nr:hypothetical protein [Actinoplanes utahensis]GIF30970.1 hypothetical protein Aut01nite_39560 [Actinoplanes utahensis]